MENERVLQTTWTFLRICVCTEVDSGERSWGSLLPDSGTQSRWILQGVGLSGVVRTKALPGIQLLTRNRTKLCSRYTWDASNQNYITLSRTSGPGRGFQPEAGVDEQNRLQDRKNPHLGWADKPRIPILRHEPNAKGHHEQQPRVNSSGQNKNNRTFLKKL